MVKLLTVSRISRSFIQVRLALLLKNITQVKVKKYITFFSSSSKKLLKCKYYYPTTDFDSDFVKSFIMPPVTKGRSWSIKIIIVRELHLIRKKSITWS